MPPKHRERTLRPRAKASAASRGLVAKWLCARFFLLIAVPIQLASMYSWLPWHNRTYCDRTRHHVLICISGTIIWDSCDEADVWGHNFKLEFRKWGHSSEKLFGSFVEIPLLVTAFVACRPAVVVSVA